MSRLMDAPVHLREGLRIVLRRPFAALVCSLTIGLGLFVAALATWSTGRLSDAQGSLDADLLLHAALDPALDQSETEGALKAIAADEAVRSVRWVGPSEQRERLGATLGEELLAGLDQEVFPLGGMAEIQLKRPVIQDPEALAAFRGRLSSIDAIHGIDGFPFDLRHIKVLLDAASVSRLVGFALGSIGLLAAVLAVFLLIQSERRRDHGTLQVFRDFGATAAFIRARFFVAAGVLALAGAAGAVLLGILASGPLSELVSIVPGLAATSLAGPTLYAWSLGGALVVGLGGCALALRGEGRIHGAVTAEPEST